MAIVPVDVPMTAGLCEACLMQLARRYPGLTVETLTETAYGRPVLLARVGEGPRRVVYSAAHHANEWITAPLLLKFLEELCQAREEGTAIGGADARRLLEHASLVFVPMVDPDGVDLVTGAIAPGGPEYADAQAIASRFPAIPFPDGWKANLLGVDLNLQYPAGWLRAREIKFSQGYTRPAPRDYVGRAPLNQAESRALADFTRQFDPALVLAFHTQGKVIYWQFEDYVVPGAQALAQEFSRVSGYALEDTPESASYAGYKDWFIQEFRRPGFTIEVGEGENPLPIAQFPEIYLDNVGILVTAAAPAGEI